MQAVAAEKWRLHIVLTNTARDAIKQHVSDEHAFFQLQKAFVVFFEKLELVDGQIMCTLYFDGEKNKGLAKKFPDRICIMDCLFDAKSGLVAKSFRTRGKGTPVATNRRARMLIQFVPSRMNGHTYPKSFLETVASLPFAKERYEYVNKRITSWEGYLSVLNKNADFEDIEAKCGRPRFHGDFTHVVLQLTDVNGKQWKQLKGLSARLKGYTQELGDVVKIDRQAGQVEIELKAEMARLARRNELTFDYPDITFSNAATKAQLRRLLQGFERLKEGLAVNAQLERILFEDQPTVLPLKPRMPIEFHNRLNEFQQAAVEGAMRADDLYVIQGPPGTGKTTVISEICYQNALQGLKTLVASQSNLAVDNALGRLLSNKDIRILRYGRTESIEEEGKRFIEENVASYWKEQTVQAIDAEVAEHASAKDTLTAQIAACDAALEQLNAQEQLLKLQKEEKERATEQLKQCNVQVEQWAKTLAQQERALEQLHKVKVDIEPLENELAQLTEKLQAHDVEALQQMRAELNKQVSTWQQALEYATLVVQLQAYKDKLAILTEQLEMLNTNNVDAQLAKIETFKKTAEVEAFIHAHELTRSFLVDRYIAVLEERKQKLAPFTGIDEVYARLQKANQYMKEKLMLQVTPEMLPPNHHYSIAEVDSFLTQLARAIADKKLTQQNGYRSALGVHFRLQYVEQARIEQQAIREDVLKVFRLLKEEVKQLLLANSSADNERKQVEEAILNTKGRITAVELHLQSLEPTEESKEQIEQQIKDMQSNLGQLEATLIEVKQLTEMQETMKQELEMRRVQERERLQQIAQHETTIEQLKIQLQDVQQQMKELAQMVAVDVEELIRLCTLEMKQQEAQRENLSARLEKLPLIQSLQTTWQSMLQSSTEQDLEEIRKLYVKHANVIGTTCVMSANKEFMDSYPNFDVVIIDEVSKATPPELLLPMLKGAKIILVGDHHQLPPLIGDETLQETLAQVIQESTDFTQKKELEKLLEESLFERLFHALPKDNKQMLAIQYRMHERIMDTIAPFYKDGDAVLMCGLDNSDEARDHQLEGELFTRDNHLMWFDIPYDKTHFEARMKEGASLYNESELVVVRKLLLQLEESTASSIAAGRLPADAVKSVGVISYYAEQVKRVNRLIEQLALPHLHIRTGSVDKFQGMEMDVIIVSMVRHNDSVRADIGFAKDYRRLNVALSRARELLMLVGCAEMFTTKQERKDVRKMYTHALDCAKAQHGYVNSVERGLI